MLTLYVMFAWLSFCYGFVLVSTVHGEKEANLFQTGTSSIYKLYSTVIVNELDVDTKNVGFLIMADLIIESIWKLDNARIIKIDIRAPQLHIKSQTQQSYLPHRSKIEQLTLKPYHILWESGKVTKLLLPPQDQDVSWRNFKRSIASLLQFQLLDIQNTEVDASGRCKVQYNSLDLNRIEKIKTECDSQSIKAQDEFLGVSTQSERRTLYEFNEELDFIKTLYAKETHRVFLNAKQDLGVFVETVQSLNHVRQDGCKIIQEDSLGKALQQLGDYKEYDILTEIEQNVPGNFFNVVNEFREGLKSNHLGSLKSAKAFIQVFKNANKATTKDVEKVIKAKKNQKILPQLYDILGYIQNIDIHLVVMQHLHLDKEDHQDLSERYLWALSFAQNPSSEIISDLLARYKKNPNYSLKIRESLLLSMAAMARKSDAKTRRKVAETLTSGLDYSKDEERLQFIRALHNLRDAETIPTLLQLLRSKNRKEEVLALQVLKSLQEDERIVKAALRAFWQIDKAYDTSSRTLSVDIILERRPNEETLSDLFAFLRSNDTNYEIKQYVLQRIKMIADNDETFKEKVENLLWNNFEVNNYAVLSPKGFSTALKRSFMQNPWTNGSLMTIQEMFGGIVKRGVVNVVLEQDKNFKELFSLGLFAGGLTSFTSNQEEGDNETANAGMELSILDNKIRPFVFFTGQSELMGHVWSGTGSEKTNAFQALILLQEHHQFLRLGSGFIAEIDLTSGVSFDLSGKIEISIWSRTADSVVEKSAAILTSGHVVLQSSFVTSQVNFSASVEPKLNIKSDIDFSGAANLCMRVSRPETAYKNAIFKSEKIPGSKHKIRISKSVQNHVPALTYVLNRKNSDMCYAMFG